MNLLRMHPIVPCRYRSKSSHNLPFITDPIVFEILTWVPAQDLVRYKGVCKQWRSWIDEESFIELQKNRAPKSIIGTTKCPTDNTIQLLNGGNIFLTNKTYGLLLGSSSCGLVCTQTGLGEYRILNPATSKSLILPQINLFHLLLPSQKPTLYPIEMRVYPNPQSRQFNVVAICKYRPRVMAHWSSFYWAFLTIGVDDQWRYDEFLVQDEFPIITWSAFLLCETAPICLKQYGPVKCLEAIRLDPCTGKASYQKPPFYVEDSKSISIMVHEWDGKFSISSIEEDVEIQTWVLEDFETNLWRNKRVIVPRNDEMGFNGLHAVCFVQEGKMWLRSRSKNIFSLDLITNKVEKITGNGLKIYDFETYQGTLQMLGHIK